MADKKKLLAMIKPAKPIHEMTDAERDALAAQIVGVAKTRTASGSSSAKLADQRSKDEG